jgi:hypothetical protein
MTIPLLGFVRGDSLGLILLIDGEHSIAELALRAQRAAAIRVAPAARASVYFAGVRLAPELTVAAAGLGPLDRVDIVPLTDAEDIRA